MNKSRSFEYEKKNVKSAVRFPNEISNKEIYLWTPPVPELRGCHCFGVQRTDPSRASTQHEVHGGTTQRAWKTLTPTPVCQGWVRVSMAEGTSCLTRLSFFTHPYFPL